METFKSLFASKAIWTSIIGVLLAIAIAAGWLPTDFDTAQATAIILGIVSALTGLFRFTATEQLAVEPQKAAAKAAARRRY